MLSLVSVYLGVLSSLREVCCFILERNSAELTTTYATPLVLQKPYYSELCFNLQINNIYISCVRLYVHLWGVGQMAIAPPCIYSCGRRFWGCFGFETRLEPKSLRRLAQQGLTICQRNDYAPAHAVYTLQPKHKPHLSYWLISILLILVRNLHLN